MAGFYRTRQVKFPAQAGWNQGGESLHHNPGSGAILFVAGKAGGKIEPVTGPKAEA